MRKVNLQKTKPRSGAVQSVLSAYRYERSQSLKKAKQQADIITSLSIANRTVARKSGESGIEIAHCGASVSLPKLKSKPEMKTEVNTAVSSFEKKKIRISPHKNLRRILLRKEYLQAMRF